MIGIVDAATGIAVLQPCPADVVVLFEDDERDAGLLQTVRGEQARHPGADDHHPEVEVGREVVLAPTWGAPIFAARGELLFQEG